MQTMVRAEETRRVLSIVAVQVALLFCLCCAVSLLKWQRFDYSTILDINRVAHRSVLLDHLFGNLSREMFSNLIVVSLVWYAWFRHQELDVRAGLLLGVVVAFFAAVFSRGLQLVLPTHLRPLHDPNLHFRLPFAVNGDGLNHWSSFPSDHAAIFFGLAMAIWLADRKIGTIALLATALFNFARIYLGFHYPTDVLGGGALGILCVTLAYPLRRLPRVLAVTDLSRTRPAGFYAISFYLCFGIVRLMQDFRDLAAGLAHHLHHHAG